MFSFRTKKSMSVGLLAVAVIALLISIPTGFAQKMVQYPKEDPTVDNVLDNPEKFEGQTVTLWGEIDQIYSGNSFAMEDDADLLGEDRILVLSVWPDAKPELIEGAMRDGKIVKATGVIKRFDRAALESEFGTAMDLSSVPANRMRTFEKQPVLILGSAELAASRQQQLAVVEAPTPEPLPAPEPEIATQPTPEPVIEEPALTEPEPTPAPVEETFEEPAQLPKTATGLPLVGLIGFVSIALGMGVRIFRQ